MVLRMKSKKRSKHFCLTGDDTLGMSEGVLARRKNKANALEYSFGQRPRALGQNWKRRFAVRPIHGLVAQQSQPSSNNRGCAALCGSQAPRHTPCTHKAGRRLQRDHPCMRSSHTEKHDLCGPRGPAPRRQPPL